MAIIGLLADQWMHVLVMRGCHLAAVFFS